MSQAITANTEHLKDAITEKFMLAISIICLTCIIVIAAALNTPNPQKTDKYVISEAVNKHSVLPTNIR